MVNRKQLIETLDILERKLTWLANLKEATISQVIDKLKDQKAIEQYAASVKAGKPEVLSSIFGIVTSDDRSKNLSNAEIIDAVKKAGITGTTPAQKQILNYISTMRPEGVTKEKLKTAQDITPSGKSPEAWKALKTYQGVI